MLRAVMLIACLLATLTAGDVFAQDASDVHALTLDYIDSTEKTLDRVGWAHGRLPLDEAAVTAEVVSQVWDRLAVDGPALLVSELDPTTWDVALYDDGYALRGSGRLELAALPEGAAEKPFSATVERVVIGQLRRVPAAIGSGPVWVLGVMPRETFLAEREANARQVLQVISWAADQAEILLDLDAFLEIELGEWEEELDTATDGWTAIVDTYGTAASSRNQCVDPACVANCRFDFQIDLGTCDFAYQGCLEDAALTTLACTIGCALLSPAGALICLPVCAANHLRLVRACQRTRTACVRAARIDHSRCVRDCIQ